MDSFSSLHWREPIWLLLALQPLVIHSLRRLYRKEGIAQYADKKLLPWVIRSHPTAGLNSLLSPNKLYLLAWLLFAVALAGPRIPQELIGKQGNADIDISIVIDVSRSMQVMDTQPSRLERAQIKLRQSLQHINGPRIGLIVFAARPHVLMPLTSDYAIAKASIDLLDKLVLPTAGSQVPAALALALNQLEDSQNKKAIILLTDGDLTEISEQSLQAIANTIKQSNTALSILGLGTVEGDAIPLPGGGWLEHEARPVISRAQEQRLQQLADWSDGHYHAVSKDDKDWEILYGQNILSKFGPQDKGLDNKKVIWRELFPWALLPAILLFFFSTSPYQLSRQVGRKTAVTAIAVLIWIGITPNPAYAEKQTWQAAYQLFKQGDYASAKQHYAQLANYNGRMGEAASLYHLRDYEGAIQQFSQAALEADNDEFMAIALYNLGNSYFQSGNYAAAIDVYRDALVYRAKHAATQNNLNISRQLKARVEQRQRKLGIAPRPGRGPQTARVEASIPIRNDTGLSLDQSEDSEQELEALPPLPEMDAAALEQLIENGLRHVRVAASEATGETSISWDESLLNQAGLDGDYTSSSANLWQRLFELEEGFQAPLEEARPVPGVAPW